MQAVIPHRNFNLVHQARRHYDVIIPKGVTVDDLLIPATWQHYAQELHAPDLIEVRAEDGSFDGLLRVTARGTHGTSMRIVYMTTYGDKADVKSEQEPDSAVYAVATVSWGGNSQKWRIVLPNGTVALSNFADKESAELKRLELSGA